MQKKKLIQQTKIWFVVVNFFFQLYIICFCLMNNHKFSPYHLGLFSAISTIHPLFSNLYIRITISFFTPPLPPTPSLIRLSFSNFLLHFSSWLAFFQNNLQKFVLLHRHYFIITSSSRCSKRNCKKSQQ